MVSGILVGKSIHLRLSLPTKQGYKGNPLDMCKSKFYVIHFTDVSKSARTEGAEAKCSSECDKWAALTVWYGFSWGGPCSPGAKKCAGLVICTFCRSAQHCPDAPFRSDMAATLARLGVNFGQQRPNYWLQLRPNFGPTWLQDGATWPQIRLI